MPTLAVIINPHARKNRGRDRAAEMRAALGDLGTVHVTPGPDALGPLFDGWARDGMPDCVVTDGGDGALHCALNAAWARAGSGGPAMPAFLPTNGGTIDFVARKVGLHGDGPSLVARLARAAEAGPLPTHALDSFVVDGECEDGRPFARIGFAMAAAGIGQRFFDHYYDEPDPHAATIVSLVARAVGSLALSALTGRPRSALADDLFRPAAARVEIDGVAVPSPAHGAIHAGAFDVDLGGVFRVFPLARESGALHFQAGEVGALDAVRNLPNLVAGRRLTGPRLVDVAGAEMRIEATGAEPLRPVIDGERFAGLRRLSVRRGPAVRIAVPRTP